MAVLNRKEVDFMERITRIFLYQMEKKQSKQLLWKIVHKLLNKMI